MRSRADELRRLIARLGQSTAAHAVSPLDVGVHAIETLGPGVRTPSLVLPAAPHRSRPPAADARACGPEGLATAVRVAALGLEPPAVGRAATLAAAQVHAVPRATTTPHRRGTLERPLVREARERGGLRLRTQRRSPVPWNHLSRERLGAAWARVQADHGDGDGDGGEMLLVGVVGPVSIESIAAVVLEPDGRVAITFSRRGAAGPRGDVALARYVVSGRLVRCDVAYPPDMRAISPAFI